MPSAVCGCRTGIETAGHISWECLQLTKEGAELMNTLTENVRKQTLRSLAEMLKMQNLWDICKYIICRATD